MISTHRSLLTLLLVLGALTGCPTGPPGPDPTDDDDTVDDDDASADDDDNTTDDDDVTDPQTDCETPPVEDPAPDPEDCNADGVLDAEQLATGEAFDCDGDGVLDECGIIDDACVTYGARDFIEYDAGNLPIVISAPHGGLLEPEDIPDRADATGSRDVNTIQLARALDAALFERTGRHPHLVICQLHRDKIDCNRSLDAAQDGHPETVAAWFEYHAFIGAAKRTIVAQYGRGLYVDLHGLASSRTKNELGYLLYPGQLYEDDARLAHPAYARRSSIRTLAGDTAGNLVEPLRGLTSLGAHLQAAGFDSVPSPASPDPGYDDDGEPLHYFNGGYNTARHGSRGGGPTDGLQIETVWEGVRDSEESRAAFAAALADGLLQWLPDHHGLDVDARNLVRLGPVHGSASERGATATVAVRRSGDLSDELTVDLGWEGSVVGVDLAAVPDSVLFEAGTSQVDVEVAALPDGESEGPEQVSVEVLPGAGYNVDPQAGSRAIRIVDRDSSGLFVAGGDPDALVEGGDAVELEIWRDTCGLAQDVRVEANGEASGGDLQFDGSALADLALQFGPDDASLSVELTAAADGSLEGVESLVVGFATGDDAFDAETAAAVVFRVLDSDQDPDLLAWFDGRISGALLTEATADAVRAELLPSAADGPQPGDGGPAGMYLTFDELDDMVIVDDLPLTGPFTVAFGFRASAELSEGSRYLYGHGNINQSNHLNVYLTTAGTLRTSLRGSGDAPDFDALDVSGELRDGAWHHVAVVVVPGDPSEATVYVDGVESASAPRGGPDFDPRHPIYLGSRWDLNPTRDYAGDLDEVMLIGRALDPTDVAELADPFAGR